MKMRIAKSIVYICVSLALLLTVEAAASTEKSKQAIRVGYVKGNGITGDENKEVSGYGCGYLDEVSKYTGWQYEYIPYDWNDGIKALEKGEIDLFGPMQKNSENKKLFDFPEQSMAKEYIAIYVSERQNKLYYNDPASMDGMVVATMDNGFYRQFMDEYCKKNNIQVSYVDTTWDQCEEDLANGKFDAIISGSLLDMENGVTAARFSAEAVYFAVSKENEAVLNGLNYAGEEIYRNNIYFEAQLYKKYYDGKANSKTAFTREEMEYLSGKPVLRVVGDPDWRPMEYYNRNTNSMEGINIELIRELFKINGSGLEFIPTASYEESQAMIRDGRADLLLGYAPAAGSSNLRYSEIYFNVPLVIVGSQNIDMENNMQLGIHSSGDEILKTIKKKYPHYKYVDYTTMEGLLDALQSGRETYAILNYYIFDELSWKDAFKKYTYVTIDNSIPLKIGISPYLNKNVIEILNKSIKRLSSETINSIVFSNMARISQKIPLQRILQENAAMFLFMLVIILSIIFIVFYMNSKRTRRKLQTMAYVDDLTGLSTLEKFRKDAANLLKQAKPMQYALIYIDINNFRYINENFGYETGDKVLEAVSSHFLEHAKWFKLSGRISADNFVFLQETVEQSCMQERFAVICNVAQHMLNILPDKYELFFSAGVYVITNPEDSFSPMLDKANEAHKKGKGLHLSSLQEYTMQMNKEVNWNKEVTLYMEEAFAKREFKVYFQPKYSLFDEKMIGAEALIRWEHPKYGLLSPSQFVPLFEKNGFIQKIDYYVFEEVCRLLSLWGNDELPVVPVSVNFSRLHLHNAGLVEELMIITGKYEIDPKLIETELTESIVFNNSEVLINMMKQIRAAGFSISIDDFGSGYSSLNLLADLPANVLKLDKGLIDRVTSSDNGERIIHKVIEMAQSLCMTTVAEGVETKKQVELLRKMGCDIVQGYYYAKPMTTEEFTALFNQGAESL